MATLIGPLLSVAASGSFADRLTFLKTKRGTNVRVKIHQSTGRSGRQTSQRAAYSGMLKMFFSPYGYPPVDWDLAPRVANGSDVASYLQTNLRRWSTFSPPGIEYPITDTGAAGTPVLLSSAINGHDVTMVWSVNAGSIDDNCYALGRSSNALFDLEIDNVIHLASVPLNLLTIVDRGVPAGTWYYRLRGASYDGVWGPSSLPLTIVI
jgi:hypothetical protein